MQKFPLTCLGICRMLSITSTGNVILCLNGGGCHVYSVSLVCSVVWPTLQRILYIKRDKSFLHDITHHSSIMFKCWNLLFGSKKDEVVVCKNACINPLNHFPAVWSRFFFFSFFFLLVTGFVCFLNQCDKRFQFKEGWLLSKLFLIDNNECECQTEVSFFLSPSPAVLF